MTATEQVERLKAARRAELKAAEDARKYAEEERSREADRVFLVALGDLLREVKAEWLLEFHTGTERPGDTERSAVFAIPGHAPVKVTFIGNKDGFHPVNYTAGYWWVCSAGHMRLDDALIVAEAAGEPIPL